MWNPPTLAAPGRAPTLHRGRVVAKQILVVEDDAYLRDLQLLVLSGAGYAATALETATEALHRLGEIRPHLIVLDVSLPGMDGRDFLKRLRGSPLWRHVPVIVSSGLPAAEIGPLRSGETELLGKPFSDAALLARVRSLIGEA